MCSAWSQGASGKGYVADGPFLVHAPDGSLTCLWTSYRMGSYALTQAVSPTGEVEGPWEQKGGPG